MKAKELAASLGVSEAFARLLVARGFTAAESARSFLYPDIKEIEDPFLLSGMKEAVARIRAALDAKEKIVVYGDYDCDGITATAILYDYLAKQGADVSYYIPNRFETGYGLTTETIEEIAETLFPDLIITVDCGISSVEEAEYLQDVLAIDLIVTDHHTLPAVLPNAILVDPKLNPESRSSDLCGAGVAFKLVQALGGMDAAWRYIELAAVGTIADIVPLTKENRLIAYFGLKKINSREKINKGLRLLIESIGVEKVSASDVGYYIAPRINALGRLEDCSEVVNLFTTDEYVVLAGLVEKLTRVNELRKSLVTKVYAEALELLKEYDLASHKIIFLYKSDWNVGILGLVAGRLKGEFSRPVILVSGEDELRGSARSPEGVDIYRTVESAAPFLVKFGGHKGAAGLTVLRENLIVARNAMDDYLSEHYSSEAFSRSDDYDLAIASEEATIALADEISLLEPTGEGNRKPVFRFSSEGMDFFTFGNGAHVKCKLNPFAEIVGYFLSYLAEGVALGGRYDLLCECYKDVYKNREKAQMKVIGVFAREFSPKGEDILLFNRYLRSNLYREEPCDFEILSEESLSDVFYDDDFCTLFLCFSKESFARLTDKNYKGLHRVEYGKQSDAPWNELLIAPEKDPVGYKRIVLLDTPLSKGYVARLAKVTGASIFVLKDRYPYADYFRRIDLSVEALRASYDRIGRFVYAGNGVASPVELAERLAPEDPFGFLVRFYVLYESGSIGVGQGFVIAPRTFVDPMESILFRRVVALKKKL